MSLFQVCPTPPPFFLRNVTLLPLLTSSATRIWLADAVNAAAGAVASGGEGVGVGTLVVVGFVGFWEGVL